MFARGPPEEGKWRCEVSGVSGEPTPNPSKEGNLRGAAATTFEHLLPRPNTAGQFPSLEGLGVGSPEHSELHALTDQCSNSRLARN